MFRFHSKICMTIVKELAHSHHYYNPRTDLSYICLRNDELVFIATEKKFQILGQPSLKWDEGHLINMNETGKKLAGEILEQVEQYQREGEAFISAEEWFAELNAYQLKMREWERSFWVDDIKRLEIGWWANFLKTQENPIFQDLAVFLDCHLDNYKDEENLQEEAHLRGLLELEVDAAKILADFFANHSNDVLREGADWIPQWIGAHAGAR